jgi:hypothetical protein
MRKKDIASLFLPFLVAFVTCPLVLAGKLTNRYGYYYRGGVLEDQYRMGPYFVVWRRPQPKYPSEIHRRLLYQDGSAEGLGEAFQ